MADRLVVIACRNNPADIEEAQRIPIAGGMGAPAFWPRGANPTGIAVWGAWSSTFWPNTRPALRALRDAGRHRVVVWDLEGTSTDSVVNETHQAFLTRCREQAAGV